MANSSAEKPKSLSPQVPAGQQETPPSNGGDENELFSAGYVKRRTTLPRSTRAWGRGIVWALIGLTSFAIMYGFLNKIDSSINARGELVPTKGKREISPAVNGIVKTIFVKDGEYVTKGKALFNLTDESTAAVLENLQKIRTFWSSELVVSQRILGLKTPDEIPPLAELNLAVSQQETLLKKLASKEDIQRSNYERKQAEADLRGTTTQLQTNRNILRRYQQLYSQGAISELDALRQADSVEKLRAQQDRQRLEVLSAERKSKQTTIQGSYITALDRKQTFTRYLTAAQEYLQVENRIADQKYRLSLQVVRAPIDGYVHNLSIGSGELATPNRPSLALISDGKMRVKIFIKDSEIGFVKVGMPAEIRIDSYPFTEYGAIKGKLTSIGKYSLPPDQAYPFTRFPATVELASNVLETKKGGVYTLRAGMSVAALIIVSKRPVISIVTDKFNTFFDNTRTIR
jgi:HlyD family secretion protein